jgi:hypothetical protein
MTPRREGEKYHTANIYITVIMCSKFMRTTPALMQVYRILGLRTLKTSDIPNKAV